MNQQSGEPTGASTAPVQSDIAVASRDGVRVVELLGDHDVTTVAKVRAAIVGDAGSANVVLSLERVTFMDSSIIGALFTSNRMLMDSGIRLVVHCPAATPICRMLELAHVNQVVDVFATFQEAVDRAAAA